MPAKRWLRHVAIVATGLLIGYLVVLGGMFTFQRELQYPLDATRADPATAGITGLEEIALTTDDGERLVAWHRPPDGDRPVLVYFHGNAGNLSRGIRLQRFRILAGEGYGFLAVSYRGYGGSTGTPTEAGLHADARAAYAEASRRHGPDRLIAYGESLGTGVATRLAVERPVRALVLEAPYTATSDVAAMIYPFLPVHWLMLDQFRSIDIIGRLRAPLLILHGDRDMVIPVTHGERLFAAAPEPKRLVIFTGGQHEDSHLLGGTPELNAFVADVFAGRIAGAEVRRVPR